jgi:serine phosphatase RsbU (regulator of sigma subunit)/CHASE3 domain sensor protein
LLLALGFAVQGAFQTRTSIAQTFARQSKIQTVQTAIEELQGLQINEQNELRGYSLTHDDFYVDQYRATAAEFDARERAIHDTLQAQRLTKAEDLLDEYGRYQSHWRVVVATPVLLHPNERLSDIDKSNKFFSDQEASIVDAIGGVLTDEIDVLARSTQKQLDRSSYVRAFWLLLFGLLAILFNGFRSRLYRELEEERTTTEILQRAFRSEARPLPHCEVGSRYVSATSHVAVGGDVFDVFRLSNNLALLLIADVSGKGIDAAVLTAFIKFTIRGIALRLRDPSKVLAEFNTAFQQTVGNPDLFVSMWVGLLDTDSFMLRYGSAGHDSAYVRRAENVTQLPVTGPILGVMEEPFETRQAQLEYGDLLVLATDGLTEARTRTGKQLLDDGAMNLIRHGDRHAQKLADELVARVRKYSRNRLRDDLAILVVRALPGDSHA